MKKMVDYKNEISRINSDIPKTARKLGGAADFTIVIGWFIVTIICFSCFVYMFKGEPTLFGVIGAIIAVMIIIPAFILPALLLSALSDLVFSVYRTSQYAKLQIEFMIDSYEDRPKTSDNDNSNNGYNDELPTI